MLIGLKKFNEALANNNIRISNKKLNTIVHRFNYFQFFDESEIIQNVYQNITQSNVIIIGIYPQETQEYFIICLHDNLIIVEKKDHETIIKMLSEVNEDKVFFFPNSQNNLRKKFPNHITQTKNNDISQLNQFDEEIKSFSNNDHFKIANKVDKSIINFFNIIQSYIASYLIKLSYFNNNEDKVGKFISYIENQHEGDKLIQYNENEFIPLRIINQNNTSTILLYYHINSIKIFAIKKINSFGDDRLQTREIENYKNIRHPLIPLFYGTIQTEGKEYPVIEYINGSTLNKKINLSLTQRMKIFIDLLFIIQYLHGINYIYRDLKMNNAIYSNNNQLVLIDFDRLIKEKTIDENEDINFTKSFDSIFVAPEVKDGAPDFKSDIYSLGKIYRHLYLDKDLDNSQFNTLMHRCENQNKDQRPELNGIIDYISKNVSDFTNKINKDEILKELALLITIKELLDHFSLPSNKFDPYGLFLFGNLYYQGIFVKEDGNKIINYFTLSADQNDPKAQCYLGHLYNEGIYVTKDIVKAIKLFQLSAEQNFSEAQYNLGIHYMNNFEIKKAIDYFTLSAKQNFYLSQYYLGIIYSDPEYNHIDYKKSIYYFELSAKQNCCEAQFQLGMIYNTKEDINKSLYYLIQSANQNYHHAQYYLGILYYEGKFISKDINKAIYYLELAANQGNVHAQFNIAYIYYNDLTIKHDFNKSIHYLTLAANQNHRDSQALLGLIYYENKAIKRDINKSIHYLTLAANQNHPEAQFYLYAIYYEGIYVKTDKEKALFYLKHSVSQNFKDANFCLGQLYYDENDIQNTMKYSNIASDLNHPVAQYYLGLIHYNLNNIKKAIHYFTLSANQHIRESQYYLGEIYYENVYERDINKAIHFLTLAADQNEQRALTMLGKAYYYGGFVTKNTELAMFYLNKCCDLNNQDAQYYLGLIYLNSADKNSENIKKSIYYFTLAANQNHLYSLNILGYIYCEGKYIKRDTSKGIDYLLKSANKNNPEAQRILGYFYYEGKFVKKDINKAIYYTKLSADQKDINAQFNLGFIYLQNKIKINEAIRLIKNSAENECTNAKLILGDLYFEGKYLERNIHKAIGYYKDLSNINNQYAKNNLGVIFQKGINGIKQNLLWANEYFQEAINQKNDVLAKYNYAMNLLENNEYNQSIELLIDISHSNDFNPSKFMLCLVLLKKYGLHEKILINELKNHVKLSSLAQKIYFHFYQKIDINYICSDDQIFNEIYFSCIGNRLIYIHGQIISLINLYDIIYRKPKLKDIDDSFYQGFNI